MPHRSQEIAALFPDHVIVLAGKPGSVTGELFNEELECVERAVEKRRLEFTAGRLLAREALKQLGVGPSPLLPAKDRSPIWPAGIAGTISHTRDFCAVAVATHNNSRCLGMDVEESSPLRDELIERICTERELGWLASREKAGEDRGRLGKLIFSAKEAFYKCQYPLTARFLEFEDVELEIDLDSSTFTATVRPEVNELPTDLQLSARFSTLDELIVCAVSG